MKITKESLGLLLQAYARHHAAASKTVDEKALQKLIEIEDYLWQVIQTGNE